MDQNTGKGYTEYQKKVIRNFYENKDLRLIQKLGELVSDMYLETSEKKKESGWIELHRRRTVRDFDSRPVPREVIEECIRAACSAPSGANQQPWRFVAVSDPAIKQQIRAAAEAEEREFYGRRASADLTSPLNARWFSFTRTAS